MTVGAPEASDALYAQRAQRRLTRPLAAGLGLGIREQLRLLGPLEPGSRVLDLGAGDGRLAVSPARAEHHVTAVESFRDLPAALG